MRNLIPTVLRIQDIEVHRNVNYQPETVQFFKVTAVHDTANTLQQI